MCVLFIRFFDTQNHNITNHLCCYICSFQFKNYKLVFGTRDNGISLRADCMHKYSLKTVIIVADNTMINQNENVDGNDPTQIQLNKI